MEAKERNARSQPRDHVALGTRCRALGFPGEAVVLRPPVTWELSWILVLSCPSGLQFGREHLVLGTVLRRRELVKEQAVTEINQNASSEAPSENASANAPRCQVPARHKLS